MEAAKMSTVLRIIMGASVLGLMGYAYSSGANLVQDCGKTAPGCREKAQEGCSQEAVEAPGCGGKAGGCGDRKGMGGCQEVPSGCPQGGEKASLGEGDAPQDKGG